MGDIATKRQVVKRYVIKVYADPYILQSINVSSTKIEVIHGGWTELDVQPKTFTGNNLIHNILDIPIEQIRILDQLAVPIQVNDWVVKNDKIQMTQENTIVKGTDLKYKYTFVKLIDNLGLVLAVQDKWKIYRLNFQKDSFDPKPAPKDPKNPSKERPQHYKHVQAVEIWNYTNNSLTNMQLLDIFQLTETVLAVLYKTSEGVFVKMIKSFGTTLASPPKNYQEIPINYKETYQYKLVDYDLKVGALIYAVGENVRIIYCRLKPAKVPPTNSNSLYSVYISYTTIQNEKMFNVMVDKEFDDREIIFTGKVKGGTINREVNILQLNRVNGDNDSFLISYENLAFAQGEDSTTPFYIAYISYAVNKDINTNPGIMYTRQTIHLKDIKKTAGDFLFCNMDSDIIIAYKIPNLASTDRKVYSFKFLKQTKQGEPNHTKIEAITTYFLNETVIRDLKCRNDLDSFQVLASIGTTNNLITYKLQTNQSSSPMNRIHSIVPVNKNHNKINLFSLSGLNVLYSMTYNGDVSPDETKVIEFDDNETATAQIKLQINHVKQIKIEFLSPYNKNDYDLKVLIKQRDDNATPPLKSKEQTLRVTVKKADDLPKISLSIDCMLNLNMVNQYLSFTNEEDIKKANTELIYYKNYIQTTSQFNKGISYVNISPHEGCVEKKNRIQNFSGGQQVHYLSYANHYFKSRILRITKKSEIDSQREFSFCAQKPNANSNISQKNVEEFEDRVIERIKLSGMKVMAKDTNCFLNMYDMVNPTKQILTEFKNPKNQQDVVLSGFVFEEGWLINLHTNKNVSIMKYDQDDKKMTQNAFIITDREVKYIHSLSLYERVFDKATNQTKVTTWVVLVFLVTELRGDSIQFLKINKDAESVYLDAPPAGVTETEAYKRLNKIELVKLDSKKIFKSIKSVVCPSFKEFDMSQNYVIFFMLISNNGEGYSQIIFKPSLVNYTQQSKIQITDYELPDSLQDINGVCVSLPDSSSSIVKNRFYGAIIHNQDEKLTMFYLDDNETNTRKTQKQAFVTSPIPIYPIKLECVDPRNELKFWKENKSNTSFYSTSKVGEQWSKFTKDNQFYEEFIKAPYMNCFVSYTGLKDYMIRVNFEINETDVKVIKDFKFDSKGISKIMNMETRNIKVHYPFMFMTGASMQQQSYGSRSYYVLIYSLLDLKVKGNVKLSLVDIYREEHLPIYSSLRAIVNPNGREVVDSKIDIKTSKQTILQDGTPGNFIYITMLFF